MKLTKKITAIMLAAAMVFTFAACGGGDETPTTPAASGDTTPATTTAGSSGNDEPIVLPNSASFDFGVIEFNERVFEAQMKNPLLLGDNITAAGKGNEDIVKPAFFKEAELNGEFEEHAFLISQNGEFWTNIDRIEAEFYISGIAKEADCQTAQKCLCVDEDGEPLKIPCMPQADFLTFFQWYIQGGGLMSGFPFEHGGADDNTIETIPGVADGDKEFTFGDVMKIKWDFAEFAEWMGEDFGEDVYASPAKMVGEEERGGGVLKFGLQTNNEDVEDWDFKFHWVDVKIYVYDLEAYNGFVDQVTEIRGSGPSANTAGKVIQV
jgi:hypothetical protein